jgi:hypothetical protein
MFDEWVLAGTQARQAIDVHIKICTLPYLDIMETVVKWESGVANMGADDQGHKKGSVLVRRENPETEIRQKA